MPKIRIDKVAALEASGQRPAGYAAACRAAAYRADATHLYLTREVMDGLIRRYRGPADDHYPSRGLGDTLARMTRAIGIRPCGGCEKRRDKLNRLFPYRSRRRAKPR